MDGSVDCPQYTTRPDHLKGLDVPEVLKSGHHANIEKWRFAALSTNFRASARAGGKSRVDQTAKKWLKNSQD